LHGSYNVGKYVDDKEEDGLRRTIKQFTGGLFPGQGPAEASANTAKRTSSTFM